MLQEITAPDHKLVKKIASLKEKKYREKYGEFLVEGPLCTEWALTSSFTVCDIVISQDFTTPDSLKKLVGDRQVYSVPPHIFSKMADTKTPQGILCTLEIPSIKFNPQMGLFVYLDRVRDPGNVGTIIRTADAMGFDGVVLSPDSVDPYNPKIVRSAMGSLFHIPLYQNVPYDALTKWQEQGFSLVVSALTEESISLTDWVPDSKTIIVMGNEAQGVSPCLIEKADKVVKIPMAGSAESLNVAVAAGIFLYEAAKKNKRV